VKRRHWKTAKFLRLDPLVNFVSLVVSHFLLVILRGYKALVSPMLPNACRFVPTCSEYAAEAIERYGAFRGTLKAIWRILRCHPFSAGGFDPVILPEKPTGEPVCVCHARNQTAEKPEHPPVVIAAHTPASLNLRLNHFWRC
jgi:putative membrane protein insertion efficiency factor